MCNLEFIIFYAQKVLDKYHRFLPSYLRLSLTAINRSFLGYYYSGTGDKLSDNKILTHCTAPYIKVNVVYVTNDKEIFADDFSLKDIRDV